MVTIELLFLQLIELENKIMFQIYNPFPTAYELEIEKEHFEKRYEAIYNLIQ